jgi:hypothetical protein
MESLSKHIRSNIDNYMGIFYMIWPNRPTYKYTWYNFSKQKNRNSGPARIIYDNYKLDNVAYYKNDRLHRINGAALIDYNCDGKIFYQTWYEDGKIIEMSSNRNE